MGSYPDRSVSPRAESYGFLVLSGQAGARVRQQFGLIDKVQRAFLLDDADEFALLRRENRTNDPVSSLVVFDEGSKRKLRQMQILLADYGRAIQH
jgi:hypothetical protein